MIKKEAIIGGTMAIEIFKGSFIITYENVKAREDKLFFQFSIDNSD